MSYVEFANSEKQEEIAKLLDEGLSGNQVADRMSGDPGNIRKAIRSIKGRAQKSGYNPDYGMLEGYPEGQQFTKATIHRKADGTIIQVWDRMKEEAENAFRTAEAIIAHTAHRITPLEFIPPRDIEYDTDIIPWFQIGDAHLGMMAIESQVGHGFDLEMAERELKFAMASLIAQSQPSERCVINDLGDGVHFENEAAVTAHSGHALDASAPLFDVAQCYIECMTFIIETALTRHKNVDVIINQGNHSRTLDFVNAASLRKLYGNNPRVTVLDNRSVFIPYRMGNTFVLCHHTDKCKPGALAGVMANDFAQDWGETFYHYMDGGHVHHGQAKKEANGALYESWNQMAPSDKYAHDGGWRSRQMLTCVLRSKTYGEKGRITVTAEEVKDRIEKLAPGTTAARRRVVHTV